MLTNPTIDTETVRRQVRVAKLVMAARYFDFSAEDIANNDDGERGSVFGEVHAADPTFGSPSKETWRLVVAHLSVVSL